jgi:hypothetical protein
MKYRGEGPGFDAAPPARAGDLIVPDHRRNLFAGFQPARTGLIFGAGMPGGLTSGMNNLNVKALGGLLFLVLAMASLLFVSAGTLGYGLAWAFLAVFGGSALAITLYLMKNDRKLLERRVYAGATAVKETSQQIVQFLTTISRLPSF